ncbi:MAG: prolyl oligopeptidase family serine peptidase [Phycisphaerae bacterium]|nr:prolyl oligopeptidase family serine peptidase [Gemmatimonadaceae bacterium]
MDTSYWKQTFAALPTTARNFSGPRGARGARRTTRTKAATLFINGEIDQRVPFSEAQQMFVALQKNGVPSKMIVYADMPHGISGSWNIVHRMLNEREWLDRYLKPAPVP